MVSSLNLSVSGLNAAAKRLEVSARNVANQSSTKTVVNTTVVDQPPAAQRAISISNAQGGVQVKVEDKNPPTAKIFDPTAPNADANGASEVPNVDIEEEFANQLIATYDYKANLKALKAEEKLQEYLLDIKS